MKSDNWFWAVLVILWIAAVAVVMWRAIVEEDREHELRVRQLEQVRDCNCNCAETPP